MERSKVRGSSNVKVVRDTRDNTFRARDLN